MVLQKTINDGLLRLYGKETATGLQKYRVVWSGIQTEKRMGKYDILTQETGIWLGSKQGVVEIKKYWYFKKECWVLERAEPNLDRKDLFYEKFTYEPIFTFLDKDDNPLPLNWRVIELIVGKLERAEKRVMLTEEDHRQQEEKKIKAEEEKVYGILDAPDPIKELPTFKSSTLILR